MISASGSGLALQREDTLPIVFAGLAAGIVVGVLLGAMTPECAILCVGASLALTLAVVKPMWAAGAMLLTIPFQFYVIEIRTSGLLPVQIASLVLIAGVAIASLTRGELRLRRTPLDIPIFLWLAVNVMSGVETMDPMTTLRKTGMIVVYVGVYYIVVTFADTTQRAVWVSKMLVLGCVMAGAYAIWVSYAYLATGVVSEAVIVGSEGLTVPRAATMMGGPNALADLMQMAIPIALALFVVSTTRLDRALFSSAAVILLASLGFTFSRGAWIGAIAGLAVLATDRRFWGILLAIFVGTSAVAPGVVLERLASSAELGRGEIAVRFEYWRAALHAAADRPLLGIGTGNFESMLKDTAGLDLTSRGALHAHNAYLHVLAEDGALGLLVFCLLIGSVLILVSRRSAVGANPTASAFKVAIAASMIAYLVQSFTESQVLWPTPNTVLWTVMGLAVVFSVPRETQPSPASADNNVPLLAR